MKLYNATSLLWKVFVISFLVASSKGKDLSDKSIRLNLENGTIASKSAVIETNKALKRQESKSTSQGGYQIFKTNGKFTVPPDVKSIRVLAVGGGGGGGSGHTGGGGSGYVTSATFAVTPGTVFPVKVGKGGAGAAQTGRCSRPNDACNELWGNEDGNESSFDHIRAAGGKTPRGRFIGGHGGSGGGGGGHICDNQGTIGGHDGSDGANCRLKYYTQDYESPKGGTGQGRGTFSNLLSIFRLNKLAAGQAGARSSGEIYSGHWIGGSGGGGVIMNNIGPSGTRGAGVTAAGGGVGYGGGGGSGGFIDKIEERQAGGAGADGLVYVEWD